MTGPKNKKGETTWGGLAAEVHYWGNWVIERVRKEIGDLYPPIPDPEVWATPPEIAFDRKSGEWKITKEGKPKRGVRLETINADPPKEKTLLTDEEEDEERSDATVLLPPGFLQPIAYLWTRTVRCKNPACNATVPLVRQTWLCKKANRSVALRPTNKKALRTVAFQVVDVDDENKFDFDPSAFSQGGNAACPFCGTVAELDYVKSEGRDGKLGDQLIAVVAVRSGIRGWIYLSGDEITDAVSSKESLSQEVTKVTTNAGITTPNESIAGISTFDNTLGITVRPYGLTSFSDLFTSRQLAFHICVARSLQDVATELGALASPEDQIHAVVATLACVADRATDFGSKLCVWNPYKDSGTTHTFGRQTITMVWDYSEVNHFNTGNAGWTLGLDRVIAAFKSVLQVAQPMYIEGLLFGCHIRTI